ncbi:MAG: chromate efflux transporter [Hyphomicrobiales bacterium]|nr:chromate efflux transporter [Hyphomicrobiales bacterium]
MRAGRIGEVFLAFGRLGLTAFGGPVAHLGFFREEFVVRRRWLDDAAFADLVALCQFLPGPASSQVGMALGLIRAGRLGALAAFLGFTAPSAVAMIGFALGLSALGGGAGGALHGLKTAAVAVVAAALLGMIRTLASTRETATIAVGGLAVAALLPGVGGQLGAIGLGAVAGLGLAAFGRGPTAGASAGAGTGLHSAIGVGEATAMLAAFAGLSLALPLLAAIGGGTVDLVDAFWRAGSWVFGGGHVVLPLLQAEMVETGRVSADAFLAGYGAAQAVPGPLFTFAGFLGAAATEGPGGALGGVVALLSIFAPSWLLVGGALPFWARLRGRTRVRSALAGVNAAVVGLLAAAFFDPVWTRGVTRPGDVVMAAAAFVALTAWKTPPWAVVGACAAIGAIVGG